MSGHNQNFGENDRRLSDSTIVASNRMASKSIPDENIKKMADKGLAGQLNYGTGQELDVDKVEEDDRVGQGSIENLKEFTEYGGYVFGHTNGGPGRVIVGRASSDCLQIERVTVDGKTICAKCVELDVYADLPEDEFPKLWKLANEDGLRRWPFTNLSTEGRSDEREQIVRALTKLEREGRVSHR